MNNNDTEMLKYFSEFYKSVDGNFEHNYKNIDSKHNTLLKKNLDKINEGSQFFIENFRSNEIQDDLGCPPQISTKHFKKIGYFKTIKNFISKLYSGLYEQNYRRSFFDDISVLEEIGASELMKKNPVHITPGCNDFYYYKNTTLNLRWIRYLYFSQRIINNNLLKKNNIWVDIGSYYGGLQSIICKNNPNIKFILVDFSSQLCKSYMFLKKQFPNIKHILPDKVLNRNSYNDLNNFFAYLPVEKFKDFDFEKIDLLTNFFSFGEMKRDTFKSYYSNSFLKKVSNIYMANRFVSSPYFEKTYDTDLNILDYQSVNHTIKYFDILPIHFYSISKRKVNGINAFRPLSSPYFEIIYKNES